MLAQQRGTLSVSDKAMDGFRKKKKCKNSKQVMIFSSKLF